LFFFFFFVVVSELNLWRRADNKFYVQSVKEMKNPKHITWTESNKHILTNIDSNKRFVVVGHKAGIVILDAISYNMRMFFFSVSFPQTNKQKK